MRKLILEIQTSIDGFIARKNGTTDWMIWDWGPNWGWDKALQQYHTDLTKSADCILLSKQMAQEGFKAHWKQVAENPDDSRYEFAKHITDTYKIVFSSTLKKSTAIPGGWENTDIAEGNYVVAVLVRPTNWEVATAVFLHGLLFLAAWILIVLLKLPSAILT